MKKISLKAVLSCFPVLAFLLALAAFSDPWGGEFFRVSVNGKPVLEQAIVAGRTLQTIPLSGGPDQTRMEVYYNHCGKMGTGRSISITDGNRRVLKSWHFADKEQASGMAFKLEGIGHLIRARGSVKLNLVYSSRELPEGRLLAVLVMQSAMHLKP